MSPEAYKPRRGGRCVPKHGGSELGSAGRPALQENDVYDAWDQLLGETIPPPGEAALDAVLEAVRRRARPKDLGRLCYALDVELKRGLHVEVASGRPLVSAHVVRIGTDGRVREVLASGLFL